MGWRGTMRSIKAAANAAARDSDRRRKIREKQITAESAAQDVEDWADHLRDITSLHKTMVPRIDWQRRASAPRPAEPVPSTVETSKAEGALARYAPGLFARLLRTAERTKHAMLAAVEAAKAKDLTTSERQKRDFERTLEHWQRDRLFAENVLGGDSPAMVRAIQEHQTLSRAGNIGKHIGFRVQDDKLICSVSLHGDEIVPNFRRKQVASGKLSETKMPKGDFNALYQDHVASVALRVAGEIFQILPIETCFVDCSARLLNTTTGHLEMAPILSVQFVRRTFLGLRLESLDPSDALTNFNHRMAFSRSHGFGRIVPLVAEKAPS